jgi:pimeloyl-ACP methyl ester carboxylesterase
MNRILVSHFEQAQGRGNATTLQPDRCPADGCPPPSYAGRLQNYELYVPMAPMPIDGYGLWLQPTRQAATRTITPRFASQWQIQAGESANRYLMFTPNARGTAYWYYGQAGAEVFEIWADIAHYYKIDTRNQVIGGLSMGGYAAWKLGGQFPDLFAVAPMIVPCPSAGTGMTSLSNVPGGIASLLSQLSPSFRNVPQYIWTGNRDTTCTYLFQAAYVKALYFAGNRYQWFTFPLVGHAYPLGNEFTPMVQWVNAQQKRVVNPPHITYVLNEEMKRTGDRSERRSRVLDIRTEDARRRRGAADRKDRRRLAWIRRRRRAPVHFTHREWSVSGSKRDPSRNSMQSQDWGIPPAIPADNLIDITASNVSQMTINPTRANVGCDVRLNVHTDGPLLVSFYNCTRAPEQY